MSNEADSIRREERWRIVQFIFDLEPGSFLLAKVAQAVCQSEPHYMDCHICGFRWRQP